MNTSELAPVLSIVEGNPVVSSLDVAENFGQRHGDIMRQIRIASKYVSEKFRERNFAFLSRDVSVGNGATKPVPYVLLTRDGFSFVVMGFTGAKAAKWKEAYIEAFNAMEAELLRRAAPAALPAPAPIMGMVPTYAEVKLTPVYVGAERSTRADRQGITDMVGDILDILEGLGWNARNSSIYRMIGHRFGIESVTFLAKKDVPVVEKYLSDLMVSIVGMSEKDTLNFYGIKAEPANAIAAQKPEPRVIPNYKRLDPCGDTIKDAVEEMGEAVYRAGQVYEDFLCGVRRDAETVLKRVMAHIQGNAAMTAMEKHHLQGLADELARAISDQMHSHLCAGNSLRPMLRTMIHLSQASQNRRGPSHTAALPSSQPQAPAMPR